MESPTSRTWKVIDEFPDWEINVDGVIRHRQSRVQRPGYSDSRGVEVVKFTKNGQRYLRSIEKLKRVAFTKLF